jgi:hypothetical protein
MSKELSIPVLGTPEYFLGLDAGYHGDHAATFETSLMMHYFPEMVELNRLGSAPHQGVHGADPKVHASAEEGQRLSEPIVDRLSQLAKSMPSWDDATLHRFVRAENALVSRQLELVEPGGAVWKAWQKIGEGVFDRYPELLVQGDFEAIETLVAKL